LVVLNLSQVVLIIREGGTILLYDYFRPHTQHTFHRLDLNLRSRGIVLLDNSVLEPPTSVNRLAVAASKTGKLYILNADNIGGYAGGAGVAGTSEMPNKNNVIQVIDTQSPFSA